MTKLFIISTVTIIGYNQLTVHHSKGIGKIIIQIITPDFYIPPGEVFAIKKAVAIPKQVPGAIEQWNRIDLMLQLIRSGYISSFTLLVNKIG